MEPPARGHWFLLSANGPVWGLSLGLNKQHNDEQILSSSEMPYVKALLQEGLEGLGEWSPPAGAF